MRYGNLILAAAVAIGLGGAASAAPLASIPEAALAADGAVLEYARWKGGKAWKGGHPGRHYGWVRGKHKGWSKKSRRVYYAPPRRHYGWSRGHHYGWNKHGYPHAVYFRF